MKEVLKKIAIWRWGSLETALWKERGEEVNFRCPICGDSKKAPLKKARFWFNIEKGVGYCFNCGWSGSLKKLLNDLGLPLAEFINVRNVFEVPTTEVKNFADKNDFEGLQILSLSNEKAKYPKWWKEHGYTNLQYITNEVQRIRRANLYLAERFGAFHLKALKHFFLFVKKPSSTLEQVWEENYARTVHYVFTFLKDEEGNVVGVQGRDFLGKAKSRYFTKRLQPEKPLLWGIEYLKNNKKEYVWLVEGVFDAISLMLLDSGSVAVATLSLSKINEDLIMLLRKIANEKEIRYVVDVDSNFEQVFYRWHGRADLTLWTFTKAVKDVNELLQRGGTIADVVPLTYERFLRRRWNGAS